MQHCIFYWLLFKMLWDNIWFKKTNLRGKWFIWAQSLRQLFIVTRKAWCWGVVTASLTVSSVRKQREGNISILFTFSFQFSSRCQSMLWYRPLSEKVFPAPKSFCKCLHRHTQECVSWVLLNSVKLTMNISQHNFSPCQFIIQTHHFKSEYSLLIFIS